MSPAHGLFRKPSEKVATTAVLVMANHLLLKPGEGDAPTLALFSLDPKGQSVPYLTNIAQRMFALKNATPADPDLRIVAQIVSDERSVPHRRRALPVTFTGGPVVYAADLHISRRYLAAGYLDRTALPCLAIPGYTGTLELLPHWAHGDPIRAAVEAVGETPVVTVTAAAAEAFQHARLTNRDAAEAVMRVGVQSDDSGRFALDLDPAITDSDWTATYYWVAVAVDTAHVPFVRGMIVDFDPERNGFKFDRDEAPPHAPNVRASPVNEDLKWAADEPEDLPLADEM